MLQEKELDFTATEEEVWLRRPEFLSLNPAGEVPVLLVRDDLALCGAYSISEYLEEVYPEVQFFGSSPDERAEVRRLNEWFDVKFDREVTLNIVFEKVFKRLLGYGEPNSEAIRIGKRNLRHHMDYLAHLLGKNPWLAGDYLTLADITAAAHLSCIDYLNEVDWSLQPSVKEWYALIKSRPSFRSILNDRIKGFIPAEHYDNPDF